ncbi:flagellar hook protein FlgE [Asticcacaulis sp. AND118]|uniref:flagellar hook protein FlgE n=1 Tax=Asticcacaulis sp. AND118 TaxID=2840468 RepID=UPI001CFFA226|nr:flagellar hook protein FlgE [Asticcacaulis sp. AND118]UDF04241.1 flagellar hook protein FlgE [Asticcacaulis sp. AND118]
MIAFNTAAAGALNAARMFDRSAMKVAQTAGTEAADLTSAVLDQKQAQTAFSANLAVLKTSQDMTGQLLNMKI